MAPKSLPHSITPPGLSALFRKAPEPAEVPVVSQVPAELSRTAPAAESKLPQEEPGSPVPLVAAAPPQTLGSAPLPTEASLPTPAAAPVGRPAPVRKMSKGVRVTQPEVEGKPKGRHTLVIDEMVLEELSLLAWAENMSVSAIAREAFDAYLGSRRKAVGQARDLRESFGRKKEAS